MRLLAIFVAAMAGAWAADRCSPPTPEDFTLNRLFLDSSFYERSAIRERYQRLMEKHPGSLDYQYLRARSLVGSNTPEALRLYREILDKDPDYPWVHLSQIEVYRSKNVFRNREKLTQSFLTITRVCPALFEPYLDLNEIADDAQAAQGAAKLRIMLLRTRNARVSCGCSPNCGRSSFARDRRRSRIRNESRWRRIYSACCPWRTIRRFER